MEEEYYHPTDEECIQAAMAEGMEYLASEFKMPELWVIEQIANRCNYASIKNRGESHWRDLYDLKSPTYLLAKMIEKYEKPPKTKGELFVEEVIARLGDSFGLGWVDIVSDMINSGWEP